MKWKGMERIKHVLSVTLFLILTCTSLSSQESEKSVVNDQTPDQPTNLSVAKVINMKSPVYFRAYSERFLADKFNTRGGQINNETVQKQREFEFACELLGLG